jgi:hypothetical protein
MQIRIQIYVFNQQGAKLIFLQTISVINVLQYALSYKVLLVNLRLVDA